MNLDESALRAIVDAVVARLGEKPREAQESPVLYARTRTDCGAEAGHACTNDPRPAHRVLSPIHEAMLPRIVALTPSQIGVGRAGNRFHTDLYLRAREGQADARDAVHSEVPDDWPAQHQLPSLRTRCRDRQEYLLHPNLGRRLDDTSRAMVMAHRSSRPDVQVIVGDGLSANAIVQNGGSTLLALRQGLCAEGLRTGTDFFVKYARIGVADEIGVITGARATVILVGERPGLGAGDSLSVYIAVGPKMDQDNAEKNCISNVRPIGIRPEEAAGLCAAIVKRGLEVGVGGVALGLGWGRQ